MGRGRPAAGPGRLGNLALVPGRPGGRARRLPPPPSFGRPGFPAAAGTPDAPPVGRPTGRGPAGTAGRHPPHRQRLRPTHLRRPCPGRPAWRRRRRHNRSLESRPVPPWQGTPCAAGRREQSSPVTLPASTVIPAPTFNCHSGNCHSGESRNPGIPNHKIRFILWHPCQTVPRLPPAAKGSSIGFAEIAGRERRPLHE